MPLPPARLPRCSPRWRAPLRATSPPPSGESPSERVVTGGSSGLGEATAKLLAERGARVMLGARREENLERIVSEINDHGGEAAYRVTDVTDRGQVENLVS